MRVKIQGSRMHAAIGFADGKAQRASGLDIDPNDVSQVVNDVRGFLDGAMAGVLRSLRARRIVGNMIHGDKTVDPDIFIVEPDYSGAFVPAQVAASKVALDWASQGFFVIAPVLLAYDTPFPQYLWKSRDASPATHTDEFAVLIAPGQSVAARALAFSKESGGGG